MIPFLVALVGAALAIAGAAMVSTAFALILGGAVLVVVAFAWDSVSEREG